MFERPAKALAARARSLTYRQGPHSVAVVCRHNILCTAQQGYKGEGNVPGSAKRRREQVQRCLTPAKRPHSHMLTICTRYHNQYQETVVGREERTEERTRER